MSPFTLISERSIPEINSLARLYQHNKTAARLLSLINNDENKVFGVTFRTPPADSTGLPHIMEHGVLCGSRKYPVKEPFVELEKGSLKTFLNAFTFPDKTGYPVASQNLQDFYNLIDVYLDAVLYPLIPPQVLAQEGWHYELDESTGQLTFKGVVFNEMKGNYSSPDSLLAEWSQRSVFADTPYGLDSGGDPAEIPDLTYAQYKNYHETYYHPSNAYFYFYGDDDPEERLRLLDSWLDAYEYRAVDSSIPLQKAFDAPRRVARPYDSSAEQESPRHYLTVNWLLPEAVDPELNLAFGLLSHILTATPASPLRKALIESGFGESLAGGGAEDGYRQLYYSTGMKGIAPENVSKVEALILETLAQLAATGIDPDTVAASLNTIEFHLREQNTGAFPRGLFLMLQAFTLWLYDGDPITAISFAAPLNAIKTRIASSERYFESLIQQYLLQNPHRVTVELYPDSAEGQRRETAEQARLAAARSAMSEADLQAILQNMQELKRRQETPDTPEALATIPSLKLTDIDREIRRIPTEQAAPNILYHDLFTNGIVYLDLGLNLHTLPADLLPYVPLFSRALLETGTRQLDFVRLSQRIGRNTGGITPARLLTAARGRERAEGWLFLRGKATLAQTEELLAILSDVLQTARLDHRERIRQMALEEKARFEARLVPAGHSLVNTRLRACFSQADWATEQMGGVTQLFFLRQLAEKIETDWPAVQEKLEGIRQILLNGNALMANVTTDRASWQQALPRLADVLASFPAFAVQESAWAPQPPPTPEGLTIPAQVNYVAKGANLYQLGYQLHGSALPVLKYLDTTWLWEKVRVQGGAYGGFSVFDLRSGTFTFLSYRDPNLLETLANYDGAAEFLQNLQISSEELTKSIVGAIGELDAYQLPDAKGYTALMRHLTGDDDLYRQRLRDQVLAATPEDFRAFGRTLAAVREAGKVVVLGSAEAIEKANNGNIFTVTKVL